MHINIKSDNDLSTLYRLTSEGEMPDQILITVDFFLYPKHIICLAIFGINCAQRGTRITYSSNNRNYQSYINEIGLLNFVNTNTYSTTTLKGIDRYTAMPLKRLSQEKMEEYIISTIDFFQQKAPKKELTPLRLVLSELLNNTYDHAQSEISSYVFCQYYPQLREFKFAVGDYGIGIPNSVNSYLLHKGEKEMNFKDALMWSVQNGNSTKSAPHNRGLGLANLKSLADNGKNNRLHIYSDKGLYFSNGHFEYCQDNTIQDMKGSVVEVVIHLDSLDDIENDSYVELTF